MEAALVIAFYVTAAALVIRTRRINLAIASLVLAALLVVALVVQATVSERLGGYAALGFTLAVVMVLLALRFGAWARDDEDIEVDGA
jgi:lipopolysaccharide export LptBFGC system permease protein LptF